MNTKGLARRLARLRRSRKVTDMPTPIAEVTVNEVDSAGRVIRVIETIKNLWWIEPPKGV